ncbi:MAG: winged helix-turn-helix transcriptional regulator [bacterium]
MNKTRDKILQILLQQQRCTINELADAVGINPISVRHHISKLEALGQVSSHEENHGVGRPRRIYFLTNSGMEEFPQRYLTLSIRLLENLKETLPETTMAKLFHEIAAGMVDDHTAQVDLENLDFRERLALISSLLENEGFSIEVNTNDNGIQIKETSCPYKHVGEEHPEICMVDQAIIEKVLAIAIEKTHCVLNGDQYCAYQAPEAPINEIKLTEN